MVGYASREYAFSLAEFGSPLELKAAGGWLLTRPIAGSQVRDAAGCYPLFCCADWEQLGTDLERLPAEIAAASLVVDPLQAPSTEILQHCFPDLCRAYKDHFVVDLSQPLANFVAPHHQRNASRAEKVVQIEHLACPAQHIETWIALYATLIQRHAISGVAAFSRESFAKQFRTPGLQAFVAKVDDDVVGMALWMVNGQTAHYHLAAYSERGYELKASFALFWHSLETLAAQGVWQVGLGSGAGVYQADEGLSRFKRGWSNEIRPAYLCGRVFDREQYNHLVTQSGNEGSAYFPAYRTPRVAAAA